MHAHIRPSQSGKIERSFRTLKDGFLNCTDWDSFTSIEDLNIKFKEYLQGNYNTVLHSSIQSTPRDRYIKDEHLIKFKPAEILDNMFLHIDEKTVSSDSLIRVMKTDYETPTKYIKQRVLVKYAPDDLSCIYIVNKDDNSLIKILPVDKIANSKIKREKVSYQNTEEVKENTKNNGG